MSARFEFDLIAVDLDGTLLDSQHRVPSRNRAALHRAHEAGIRIVLCTGRSYPETRPILEQIGLELDAAVTVFGAVLNDVATGRTLERTALPLPLALELTDWFLHRAYAVLWLTDRDEAGSDGYVIDAPRRNAAVDRWVERSTCVVRCTDRVPADVCAPVRLSIIDDRIALESVSIDLRREFDGRLAHNVLYLPLYDLTLIEAFAPQVNKWYGIEKLCRRWGIDPQRTVAVGDDVNDLEMLQRAGLGVAMGNARPGVKAASRRVTATNDECGVALLLEELLENGDWLDWR